METPTVTQKAWCYVEVDRRGEEAEDWQIDNRGFPTRMVYLYNDIESRYATLVGNPRNGLVFLNDPDDPPIFLFKTMAQQYCTRSGFCYQ